MVGVLAAEGQLLGVCSKRECSCTVSTVSTAVHLVVVEGDVAPVDLFVVVVNLLHLEHMPGDMHTKWCSVEKKKRGGSSPSSKHVGMSGDAKNEAAVMKKPGGDSQKFEHVGTTSAHPLDQGRCTWYARLHRLISPAKRRAFSGVVSAGIRTFFISPRHSRARDFCTQVLSSNRNTFY